ncbi:MAG: type I restriction-modification system subunit M, partial [Prevotellaceae bacterium]|nr:type I restriction-modification system subunit M [Prevotellaceae bacterium]
MAKKEIKEKAIEETLWESANKLRGSVEPAEYKHVVLGLFFLKFASDKFEDCRKELINKGHEKYIDLPVFYNQSNVFFLDETSRWLTNDSRWKGYDTPPTGNTNYAWILNIVSKLSGNGVAGFLLANGALSGDGTEKAIRRKLIENHIVEAILVLPQNMFYTTNISVTLWILNKNKTAHSAEINGIKRNYHERRSEILFMDLRQMGEPFEKKYVQFSAKDIRKIADTYHDWQIGIGAGRGNARRDNACVVSTIATP